MCLIVCLIVCKISIDVCIWFSFNAPKMLVASPSENGQVLRVVPSSPSGMAQVIIPQRQLVDVNSPRGEY